MTRTAKLKSTVIKTPPQPRKRRRTKKLYKELREQLEFYFSEANLRHDLFMREKASDKGTEYVPIQLILSFPLIQEMSVEEKHVISAIKESRILELSNDLKSVRRKSPVPKPPRNLEQSTLYVENLPPDTTTEWLRDVCRKVGAVRHVTVPRFKKSGAIKGFAFVEFSSPEEVARACRILKDPPKNFFPNRTEQYLRRMKREKQRKQEEEFKKVETPRSSVHEASDLAQSAESSCLNKSIDSAFNFTPTGNEPGKSATSSGRKRKRRRSKRMSEDHSSSLAGNKEEGFHTPAKKMKSVPVKLSYDDGEVSEHWDATTLSPNENISPTGASVSMETRKYKRSAAKKVFFQVGPDNENCKKRKLSEKSSTNDPISTVNDKDLSKKVQISQECAKNVDKDPESVLSTQNTTLKGENSVSSEKSSTLPSTQSSKSTRSSESKTDDKHTNTEKENINKLNKSENTEPKTEFNGIIKSETERTKVEAEVTDKTDGNGTSLNKDIIEKDSSAGENGELRKMKRKRCISEPPNMLDFTSPSKAKKYKEESNEPISVTQEDDAHNQQPISSVISAFDIDSIIVQARQMTQNAIRKNATDPDLTSKRFLQSVVALPPAKKSKRTRRKSRSAVERRKTRIKQQPPKLNAMPKVEWAELKQEYKRLQKQNMGKLKQILRENKTAGSVFIKKHMDVLKEGKKSDESSSSSSDESSDSAKSSSEKMQLEQKEETNEKRGPPRFTPGVIVRISTIQMDQSQESKSPSLPSIEEIKSRLSKYGHGVAYVDAKEGERSGYVRFRDGDSAQRAIMEEKSLALCLLTGELEERYWDKLLASRAKKFARERLKVRGRAKILARAEKLVEKGKRKHIRFDNDFVV